MAHTFQTRIYYEDTDLAGIVYYANYLKFIERARSEWVRALGIDQRAMKEESGVVFAVRRVEADYITPARFDDDITVITTCQSITPARITLKQDIFRNETLLFASIVTLVALTESGKPTRLPAEFRQALSE